MSGPVYSVFLLCCSVAAAAAEIIGLLMPDRILSLVDQDPEKVQESKFPLAMGILSLFYIADILLLILADDKVFKMYGFILIALSLTVWLFRSRLKNLRFLMIVESTLCLIILIDVIRTVVRNFL
ncbi:MAG: hypothetical protein GF401_20000 [Chitinivibrionales bacterium]|nr:hypothetical protein [Chitinivibrionales bacterium]